MKLDYVAHTRVPGNSPRHSTSHRLVRCVKLQEHYIFKDLCSLFISATYKQTPQYIPHVDMHRGTEYPPDFCSFLHSRSGTAGNLQLSRQDGDNEGRRLEV